MFSAGSILLITGLAKLFSTFGNQEILDLIDPIFGISFRHLMIFAGVLELIISLVCFLLPNRNTSVQLIAWLATNFLIYRLGLWLVGWRRPCPCLGSFADALHVSAKMADLLTKTVLFYLLMNSYAIILASYPKGETAKMQT